jgi:hypothetical protein
MLLLMFASVPALSLNAALAPNQVSGPLMSGEPPRARLIPSGNAQLLAASILDGSLSNAAWGCR